MRTFDPCAESPEKFDLMYKPAAGGRWALFRANVTYASGLALMDGAPRSQWWFRRRAEETSDGAPGLFDNVDEVA